MRNVEWPFIVFGVVLFAAITNFTQKNPPLWTGAGVEPRISTAMEDDPEVDAAITKARESVDQFIAAMEQPVKSGSHYSVKVKVEDENGGEHFWLNRVRHSDGSFFGLLGNTPVTVKSVRFGQPISVETDEISDWMFVQDGKLVGGFTTRVFYERMSPEERKEMDEGLGCRIEDD